MEGMFGGFPGGFPGFAHMGGEGGMPGGGGASDDADSGDSDNTKFYEILGISKDATQQQIKKAYRKKAMRLHPDKHPGEEDKYQVLFAELNRANEVLSDPDQRKLYDRYGEAGLRGAGSSGGAGMGGLFDMFFGGGGPGGGGGRGRPRVKKAPPIKMPVDVTLEDLYNGSTVKIKFKKFRVCSQCEGKGGSKVTECSRCNGRAHITVVKMMGPMRIMQQVECPECNGEGHTIRPDDRCDHCDAKGIIEEHCEYSLTLPIGAKHADQIVIEGEGHSLPGATTGPLVCILRVKKHSLYQRVGADLICTWKLSLREALCGFTIKLPHFNKNVLVIRSEKGSVMQHDTTKVVFGKGMPQRGAPSVKGNIYVKFEVKFPESSSLTEEMIASLDAVLPPDEESKEDMDIRTHIEAKRRRRDARDAERKARGMDVDAADDDDDESSEEEVEVHEECEVVEGEPTVTPASAKSAYDEDEEEEVGSGCRQM